MLQELHLSTNLPTYVLDPYFNEVREITEFALEVEKERQRLQFTKLQKQSLLELLLV